MDCLHEWTEEDCGSRCMKCDAFYAYGFTDMLLGMKRLRDFGYSGDVIVTVLSADVFTTETELLAALDAEQKFRSECSGVSANWCPVHGDCTCKDPDDKNDDDCPLHSHSSEHGG